MTLNSWQEMYWNYETLIYRGKIMESKRGELEDDKKDDFFNIINILPVTSGEDTREFDKQINTLDEPVSQTIVIFS